MAVKGKKRIFTIVTDEAKGNAMSYIARLPVDGTLEVIIRPAHEGKTMQQLGALFGLWQKELSQEWGHSEKKIHEWMKDSFLARIYITDPANELQEQWVELLAVYQMAGEQEKLERHSKRISLSWATLSQAKSYMNAIQDHFNDINQPLAPPDPLWKLVGK